MEQTPVPPNSPLQFDKADFNTPSSAVPVCQVCKKEVTASYFEVNGKIFCEACKRKLDVALTGGSPVKRVILSTVAGGGAALLGAGIYYTIVKLTGYEFGLIAIFVGLMVGGAVRWGSERRGGWFYQALAMFLTYNAIVLTYLPFIFKEFDNKAAKPPQTQTSPSTVSVATPVPTMVVAKPAMTVTPESLPTPAGASLPTPQATLPAQPAPAAPPPDIKDITLGKALLGICAILFIAYIAPFLAGFKNIIGLVILGFALYEAWKMNSKPKIKINGPFQVGQPKS